MTQLDMDASTCCPLDLSNAPLDVITMVLSRMSFIDRFTCALVCKAWAEAATAATRSIILERTVQDLSCLECWMENHGNHLQVLQLHQCGDAALTALPCPQLRDLLLWGSLSLGSRAWTDIAAATKLTSVSLADVYTAAVQADVLSAIAALPDLQELTWRYVECNGDMPLSDSFLLEQATQLTALYLVCVSTEALEHLGSLIKLQDLHIADAEWAAAGCPGLQELKALTRLRLLSSSNATPASISELVALQQLDVPKTTPTALNQLQVLSGLTQLVVRGLPGLSPESPPLQLTGLKHLELREWDGVTSMSYLERCTQLQMLKLYGLHLGAPGSLTASTVLQHLVLESCKIGAADGAADRPSWQQVFPGLGRLPHLTSLQVSSVQPALQQADMELLVTTCNNLQVLHVRASDPLPASTLTRLSGLTSLHIRPDDGRQCTSVTQVTGLRELRLYGIYWVSATALRRLAALEHLTCLGLGYVSVPSEFSPGLKEEVPDRLLDGTLALINKAPAGHPSDVPARLLRAADIMSSVVIDDDGDG